MSSPRLKWRWGCELLDLEKKNSNQLMVLSDEPVNLNVGHRMGTDETSG